MYVLVFLRPNASSWVFCWFPCSNLVIRSLSVWRPILLGSYLSVHHQLYPRKFFHKLVILGTETNFKHHLFNLRLKEKAWVAGGRDGTRCAEAACQHTR